MIYLDPSSMATSLLLWPKVMSLNSHSPHPTYLKNQMHLEICNIRGRIKSNVSPHPTYLKKQMHLKICIIHKRIRSNVYAV